MKHDVQKAAEDLIDRSKQDDSIIAGSEIRAVVRDLLNQIDYLEKELETVLGWKQALSGVEYDTGALCVWMARAERAEDRIRELEALIPKIKCQ